MSRQKNTGIDLRNAMQILERLEWEIVENGEDEILEVVQEMESSANSIKFENVVNTEYFDVHEVDSKKYSAKLGKRFAGKNNMIFSW